MKVGDLVRLRKGSAPLQWAEEEGMGSNPLFIIIEDPESEEVIRDSELFYIIHPPTGKKIPVNKLEIATVSSYVFQ